MSVEQQRFLRGLTAARSREESWAPLGDWPQLVPTIRGKESASGILETPKKAQHLKETLLGAVGRLAAAASGIIRSVRVGL